MKRIFTYALLTACSLAPAMADAALRDDLQQHIVEQVSADDVVLNRLSYMSSKGEISGETLDGLASSGYILNIETMAIQPRDQRFTAQIVVKSVDENQEFTVQANGIFEKQISIPTLNHILHRGNIIREEDISYSLVPERKIRHYHITNIEPLIGKVLTRRILPYRQLSERDIKLPNVVKKGERSHAIYRNSHINIATLVDILEDGAIGETISVRNHDSGSIIRVKISEDGELLVRNSGAIFTQKLARN